jgi:hypothetical protein
MSLAIPSYSDWQTGLEKILDQNGTTDYTLDYRMGWDGM